MRNSIDSATFAWLTKECRWARHGMFFLLKLHLRTGNQSGPHLPHASLGPLESITQTASRLVQPFLHSSWLMAECHRHAPAWPFPKIAPLPGESGPSSNTSRVPCTKVLSQEIQIFQETSFCVLQVLLRNFTNTIWQLYIDFYTIRIVFESSFQLCIFKVANLKKLWQFWQKCVDRTFVHVKHGTV